MSLEGDLEAIKPVTTTIKSNLDFIGKYRADLSYLRNGKMIIERDMAERGIDDKTADERLRQLSKSINRLEQLIDNYEKDLKEDEEENDDENNDENNDENDEEDDYLDY